MSSPWIAAHIFYYAGADGLLKECVTPLVEEARAKGLIRRFFFIRYWENGPHTRLRLLPEKPEDEAILKALVEERCKEYFQRRPAMFQFNVEEQAPRYRSMYEMEYGKEAYLAKYGDNPMPFYPSNSVQYLSYEPEMERYAGLDGVEFSEKHFEVSSRLVLETVRNCNLHVRPVLFGNSFQFVMLMSYGAWETDTRVRDFLEGYINMWTGFMSKGLRPQESLDLYDRKYKGLAPKLTRRVQHIRAVAAGEVQATPIERAWYEHGKELRAGIQELWDQGKLVVPEESRTLDGAMAYLLRSYVHMTNNRLGTTIQDEIYLSQLGQRALETIAAEAAGTALTPQTETVATGEPNGQPIA